MKYFIGIFTFAFIFGLNAQKPLELRSWTGLRFEKKIKIKNQKFKGGIEQQLRISDLVYIPNYSLLTEGYINKSIGSFYKIAVAYRISYVNQVSNRLSLSNSFKWDKGLFFANFRLKYQAEKEIYNSWSQDFRLRAKLKFKINKDYRPFLWGELFYQQSNSYSNFNRYRVGMGLDADYKKKNVFNIVLFYSQQLNIENPNTSLVLGLFYTFLKE